MTLPEFPVSDDVLDAIEHALGGAYEVRPGQGMKLVGADYSLSQLLEFYSGYDPAKLQPTDDPEITVYPEPVYTERDVIRSLIKEVRRLRNDVHA